MCVCVCVCVSECHQSDSCIKVGSDESHFNVSSIVRYKVTRQRPETTIFEDKRRAEADSNRGPSAYQPNALPLGQTSSQEEKNAEEREENAEREGRS